MLIIGWWLVMLVGGALSVEVEETSGGSRVEILRCCSEGEDLKKLGIAEGEFVCNGSPDPFKPLVYSPRTSSFLDELPKSWRVRLNARPNCTAGQQLRYVPLGKFQPMIIFDSGSIELEVGSAVFIQPHEYCLGASSILACIPRSEGLQAAATMRPKLRKCCGPNAAYDSSQACSTWRSVDNVPAMTLEEDKALLLSTKNSSGGAIFAGLEIVEGWPVCSPSEDVTIVGSMADAALQADASLLLKGQHIPAEEFCIERLRHEARQLLPAKVFTCFKHRDKGNSKEEKNKNDIRFVLYPLGFIVGAIFLAATLATGCLLPASHHVLHWRCQTRHVLCLLIGDISMAAIQLAGSSSLKEKEMCRVLAILAHFFFLATFFWLNTMCFNIWWTFRDLRPASLEKGQEMIRLRFYEAYAWGGPLIIAGLAAFLDHLPHAEGDTLLRPHFGENSCWFSPNGKTEIFAYFFGPIGVLLAINLIFFAATARELTCGLWKGEFVKSTTERAALGKVCLKLVVVMGVPWIFDVISWLVGGPNFLWYVTDVLNAAQGVLIFIVVGCQPQVRAALKRLWSRNPRANANRQGNGLSTTSHGMPSMGDSVTQNPSTKTAPLETIC